MLGHSFTEMPSSLVGTNSFEPLGILRCTWCLKTPSKAREDGCPAHELEAIGQIVLSEWNPSGVEYFAGRTCVTCERPIMEHWLRKGLREYWCYANQNQFSYGINGCVHEVSMVSTPIEETGTRGIV